MKKIAAAAYAASQRLPEHTPGKQSDYHAPINRGVVMTEVNYDTVSFAGMTTQAAGH